MHARADVEGSTQFKCHRSVSKAFVSIIVNDHKKLFTKNMNTVDSKTQIFRSFSRSVLCKLTVTCSCCPYLYFGSAIMLVTHFVNFR